MRFAVLLFLVAAVMAAPSQAIESTPTGPDARVIVRFKASADSVKARPMAARMGRIEALDVAQTRATALGMRHGLSGGRLKARMSLDERTHVVTASGMDSATLMKKLAADGEVEFAVVDGVRKHFATVNDPYYASASGNLPAAGQWYLRAPDSTFVSSINAPGAWDTTFGSPSVVVAVIDTGVRKDHPDLSGQFVGGYDFVAYSSSSAAALATANDGNGADSDASDPGDWVTQAEVTAGTLGSSCTSDDVGNSSWHGTHVSGLIAASTNNGLGMAGVAGGVKVLPVRVLGKCGGYDSDIIAGMKWAAGISVAGVPTNPNPAQVLNLSLGGTGSCTGSTGTLYTDAISQINAKGATVVVAAGNGEGLAVSVPGNCSGVIAVAALRHAGSKVGFSNVGPEVGIAAPGGNCVNLTGACLYPILSASNSGTQGPVAADNAYDYGYGTSFSTPLVAGTVALMYSVRPTITPAIVTQLLKSSARPFVTTGATAGTLACHAPTSATQDECYCTTSTCGAGMLDARAAVAAVVAINGGTTSIAVSPAAPAAGQTVTLTGSATLATGRSVASWAWSLVDGGGAVTAFTGATNASTATLAPTAAGTVQVKLTVTDDLGDIYTATQSFTVTGTAATGNSGTTSSGSSGGGGGGVFSPLWLLGLMLAAALLGRRQQS
ncbi:S8 family serine peptidase [Burkholderiaceae bacterium UC74_6]